MFGTTRGQRCWAHKTANVINKLPKSQQQKAKAALHEIWVVATRADAGRAFDRLAGYRPKYPKAADCLAKDRAALLAFYAFPAEHWPYLRTTNPIESPSPPFDRELTRPEAASPVTASWPWCSCW